MSSKEHRVSIGVLLGEYWDHYGGWVELFRSPYLYIAVILMPLMFGAWSKPLWWDTVLSILPNLLAVSLAAFTLFLGAGNEKFRELIAGEDDEEKTDDGKFLPSPFLKTAAVFLHFLVVQFVALTLALICKSIYALKPFSWFDQYNIVASSIFWCASYFIFLYALTVVMAASFGVFEVVKWFDDYVTDKKLKEKEAEEKRNIAAND